MSMSTIMMSRFARVVFGFVAINALGGALSLLVFPDKTSQLFFWTITSPLSGGLLGGLYLCGGVTVGVLALRGAWEQARFLVPVLVTAGVLISGISLLHLDTFPRMLPLIYWLLVYAAAPALAIGVFVAQERHNASSPALVPLRAVTRRIAIASGALILAAGLALLARPDAAMPWWPWQISVFMLRIFAAWFSAFGAGLLWCLVERDWRRIEHLATLMIAASTLELAMVGLHRGALTTTGPRLWLYCGHLIAFGMLGGLMHMLQRPANPARSADRVARAAPPYIQG